MARRPFNNVLICGKKFIGIKKKHVEVKASKRVEKNHMYDLFSTFETVDFTV